jgi:hypothetical protein
VLNTRSFSCQALPASSAQPSVRVPQGRARRALATAAPLQRRRKDLNARQVTVIQALSAVVASAGLREIKRDDLAGADQLGRFGHHRHQESCDVSAED